MRRTWNIATVSTGLCLALLTTGWVAPQSGLGVQAVSRDRGRAARSLFSHLRIQVQSRIGKTSRQARGKVIDFFQWKLANPESTLHYAIASRSVNDRKTRTPVIVTVTDQVASSSQRQPLTSKPNGERPIQAMRRLQTLTRTTIGLRVAALAMSMLGKPYVWGGDTPTGGFDCSGLVSYVLELAGRPVPRTTWQQYANTTPVLLRDIQPGDLLFFTTYASGPTHVGIYVGNGRFVSALNASTGVVLSSLHEPYFAQHFLGARSPWTVSATDVSRPLT